MILNEISPYICVDSIVLNNSTNYVHFLTHIDKSFIVPHDWKSVIYTSTHIFKFVCLKKNPINQKYFRILPKDEVVKITLNDGVEIKVIMFQMSEITGNLAFHFQDSKRSVLYAGPFTICREIILNSIFRQCVINGINLLYLDNTRANCTIETSICQIGEQLNFILNKHPGYQILLHLPTFGYEELIIGLLLQFGFKICVGKLVLEIFQKFSLPLPFVRNVKEADILIGEECVTAETIKLRFEKQKRLCVRIIEGNNQLKNFSMESIGLYQLNWSRHPSLLEMYSLISFVRPQAIKEIYSDLPTLPKFIHDLCLCKRATTQQWQQQLHQQEYGIDENSNSSTHNTNMDSLENSIQNREQNDHLNNVENIKTNSNSSTHNTNMNSLENSIQNREQNDHLNNLKNIKTSVLTTRKDYNSDDVIYISSSSSELDDQLPQIRLPKRISRNKKRVVGIVTPNRVRISTPNTNQGGSNEIIDNSVPNSDSSEVNIDFNELFGDDGASVSLSSCSENSDMTTISLPQKKKKKKTHEIKKSSRVEKERQKSKQKSQQINVIHEKYRARFVLKHRGIVYTDDED